MRKKVQVMWVVQSFGGGVLTVLKELAESLVRYDQIALTIIYSRVPDTPSNIESVFPKDVVLEELSMPAPTPSFSTVLDTILASAKLRRRVGELKPDVVHLHSTVAGLIGRLALWPLHRSNAIQLYYTPHGLATLRKGDTARKLQVYKWIEAFSHSLGGEIVACSQSEHLEYAQNIPGGLSRNKVVIENGIRLDGRADCSRPRLATDGDSDHKFEDTSPIRVVALGRLAAQKQPGEFAMLASSVPNLKYTWIGDGEAHYKKLLLDNGVRVTGWLEKEMVNRELIAHDIFVHFTGWEGLSIALLEAMHLGLPVVASDIPSNSDVIRHGKNGFLVSNVDELASTISTLSASPDLRRRVGSAARNEVIGRFSIERMAQQVRDLYIDA